MRKLMYVIGCHRTNAVRTQKIDCLSFTFEIAIILSE